MNDFGEPALPLYEYQCKKCHSLTERIQKFSDPPLTICPHCGGELEQLLSAPAVQFKGSGWYATDYATKSYKDSASKDSSKSGNGSVASSPESKSEDSKSKGASGAEKAGASSDQPAGKK